MSNIKSLSSLLQQISTNTRIGIDSGPIQQAVTAAQQLQVHLNEAVNVNTGKLNLTQLNHSLSTSGTSLQQLASQLQGAGEIGQQAFLKLATAIAHAEAPIRQTNAALHNLGITLINTIKWQLSSSMIHGVINSFNSAIKHAQSLNNALNDIRIVTGYSTDSMADFTEKASQAANALNTTVTEYSKAALIFYQQGLSGEAVTERANTVIKLSQVTGQSAETVSNQMTAIWNNFYDGTKSLEYYADAITKLGAATASSSDEISEGLSKFAAVADTVGLSYEYATAAVATVVAETRQSADIVGTAFKTIFARMEGLKLGETLEDGVDLNKYSEALASVGVEILDASGQLKDMDDILDDLGSKWKYFGEETKVALAQTVGGIRQYNQMLALMENWDGVTRNIDLAKNSTGELAKQQYIWSQSAEAASQRVKKAQDDLYENLISDKLIIRIQDTFAQIISSVSSVVDAMGGLGPMVLMIVGLFSNKLMPIIQKGAQMVIDNWHVATGQATRDAVRMQEVMKIGMMDMMEKYNITGPMKQQILLSKDLITAKQKLATASANMSESELKEAQHRMQVYEAMITEVQASLELQAQLEKEIALDQQKLTSGNNRKVLAMESAKQKFVASHTKTMSSGEKENYSEYVNDISEDASTFSRSEITAMHDKQMASYAMKKEEIQTDPNLNNEQRIEALEKLKQAENEQKQRYQDIIELQKQMGIEGRKTAEELKKVSVGVIDDFQKDEHLKGKSGLDYEKEAVGIQNRINKKTKEGKKPAESTVNAQRDREIKSYAATGEEMIATSSEWGLSKTDKGIDASVSNLEILIKKMSDYDSKAQQLKTMSSELGMSFEGQGNNIAKAISVMGEYTVSADGTVQVIGGYEGALAEVEAKEAAREAALRRLIEAENAAAKAGKKDSNAAKEVKKAKADLKKSEEDLLKSQTKAQTTIAKLNKESQKYVKSLGSIKKVLLETAKSSSNSSAEISRINDIFNRLGKGGDVAEQAMKDLQAEMIRLGKGSEGAANGIEDLANTMKNKLIKSGLDDDEINAFVTHLEKMGAISPEIANKMRMVGDAGENIGNKVSSGATRAAAAISSMATVASQISMGISAIQGFFNAFQEGNTPLETAMTLLMSMSMLLPLVATGIKTVTALKKAGTIVEAASNVAKAAGEKLTWKHIAAQKAEEASEMALIVVKVFRAAVDKLGLPGVVVGIALAATVTAGLIAWTTALRSNTKAKIDNNKAQSEASSNMQESINKTQELATEVNKLTEEYEKLSKAGKNTAEVLDSMNEKIPELIQSYRDLGDSMPGKDELALDKMTDELEHLYNVAKLTGDYTTFNAQKEEMDNFITRKEYDNAISGGMSTGTLAAEAMEDAIGGSIKGNKMTLGLGGADATWRVFGWGDTAEKRLESDNADSFEESKAQYILKNKMGDYYKGGHSSSWFTKTTAELEVDYTSPAQFVEYYESLQDAQREMLQTMSQDQLANSDIYRELNDAISAGAEYYEKMVPLAQGQAEAGGELARLLMEQGTEFVDSEGKNIKIEAVSMEDIDNMAEYLQYKKDFITVATEQYGLTESQAEMYLREAEGLKELTTEYELAEAMLTNFVGLNAEDLETLMTDPTQFMAYSEGMKSLLTDTFGELSDEELQIAVSIAATADSIEEFGEQMQRSLIISSRQGFEESAKIASEAMQSAVESGSFDFNALFNDDAFLDYLEAIGMQQIELTAASYEEQYKIISEFYSKVSTDAYETYQTEQNLLALQLATRQREMAAYHEAMKNSKEEVLADQDTYAKKKEELENATTTTDKTAIQQELDQMEQDFKIKYEFDIDSNASALQNEIDQILSSLDEIQDKKISLAMDWSGVDEVENGMKKAAEFSKVVANDTKKVGNQYVMTAAKAREWLEFYPELGDIAETTTDGMIAMDAEKLDAFIENNDEELDSSIDTQIKELEAQKASLEAELEAKIIEQQAAEKLKQGELDLEHVSAQYLVNLRKNLVDYYIEKGYDEQQAQVLALQTMQMNEEEYAERVAELADQQAVDMAEASELGANAQLSTLTQLGKRWKSFAEFLVNNVGQVLLDIGEALLDPTKSVKDVFSGYWDDTAIAVTVDTEASTYDYNEDGTYDLSEADLSAAYKDVGGFQYNSVTAEIKELYRGINSLDGKIDYLNALKNQDLSDYGNTDPDDDDDSDDSDDKEVEDMVDDIERYHEITRSIQAIETELDRLSDKKDKAFGKDKLALMDQEIEALEDLEKAQSDLVNAQTGMLALDLADIENNFSTTVTVDKNGNINYTDLKKEAQDEYNKAKEKYNNSAQTDEDKDALDEAEALYDKKIEYLDQYEETLDDLNDNVDDLLETQSKKQEYNFDKLNYAMELKLEVNKNDLDTIEYELSKIADDFYGRFEAIALMLGDLSKDLEDNEGQLGIYVSNLNTQRDYVDGLVTKYQNGDISQADYVQGLEDSKSEIIANLESLNELDTLMQDYYGETLAQGQEELSEYTAQMDRHTAVLNHYSNVLNIIGKSKDFESMGVILEAQAHTAENAVKVAEENYNMLRKQADQRKAEYEAELAAKGENDPGVQMLKKQWMDAEEVVGEAQDDMMQKTEEWAQALKAVVENELEGLAKELEKAFTANFGNSFEAMNTQMERAKSLQEEYLTTTNQVYETNKLIRQSQQEIDKTTNSIAKRRLKDFINETEQLQNKNKLSQFELEIQQAKYDLLLAEIALEEAQNAKSTVRLQRDSEGNFGYVYTADQNAIAEAEQKFADAQNSLYNIGLEGANDYTEKYQQTLQEFYDTMTELQTQYLNGEFETEAEYQAAMMEAQEFYYAKLQEYSELYGIAVAVDANIVRDAWSTEFQSMTQSSAQWQAAITTYLAGVEQAFGKWDAYVQQIKDKTIGPNLDTLKNKTEAIKTANDAITTSITADGGLLDALQSEYDKISALTLAYSGMREEIQGTIGDYEKLIDKIDEKIQAESGYADGTGTGTGTGDGSDTSGTDTGSGSGSSSGDSSGSGGNTSSQFGSATWERGKAAYDKINAGVWGNGAARMSNGLAAGFTQDEINLGQYMINLVYPTYIKGQGKTWEEAKKLLGFDTGGYTGDWGGSYGKLAMLHKKELVLNAGDTDNFLAGMEMLDNIVKTIDLYSMNAQLGGILSSPSFGFNNKIEPIEQNVHIEAHFPEATDRNEITEAINTLVNQASQFVNRK